MARVNLGRVTGRTAYEEAVRQGYEGTVTQWLESLHGADGKSAYEYAQEGGFIGTEEQFIEEISSIGNINEVLDAINGEVV